MEVLRVLGCGHLRCKVKPVLQFSSVTMVTRANNVQRFVPRSNPIKLLQVEQLQEFLNRSHKMLVLTGAGISTESGIPDYRSEGVGLYARSNSRPMMYQTFIKSPSNRQRYWARNFVGWPRFSSFLPNISHIKLQEWEQKGCVHWLVTQNVDALHHKAGSRRVTELHGSAHRVICLSCESIIPRELLQQKFKKLNPDFHVESSQITPDGDVEIEENKVRQFQVPPCEKCGGILKPEITFFGDNVARPIVDFVFQQVPLCDSMLIVGSSLQVYSGYRFVQKAFDLGKKIAIVNIGSSRADHLAHVKVDGQCGQVLRLVGL